MKEIEIQLLQELKEAKQPLGTEELANSIGVSRSKVKYIIKEMNESLLNYGAEISGKTGRGNGYTLMIEDERKFQSYLHEVLPRQKEEEKGLFNNQEARINYICQRFLQNRDFIKADDLCEELMISKNQLSKDLKEVRSHLKQLGIEVVNKPYYGLGIEADEIAVRQALAKMESENLFSSNYATTYSSDSEENVILARIKTIIIDECEKFNYRLVDMICDNLVTHLYVAIKRAEKQYQVEFSEEDKAKIEKEEEFELARAIILDIQSMLNVSLPRNEIYYCTIHLCSKKSLDTEYVVNSETQKLVAEMLAYLDEYRKTDFRTDFRLALRLALHMVPFLSRIRYNLELRNPMLEEIKSRYIRAFDYASVCGQFLSEKLNTTLSENELSYIALHLQLSMNDQKKEEKKNILIVCSTGRGSAALLKVKFKQEYERYLNRVTVVDYLNVLKMDVSEYDYIFSTIPLKDFKRPYLLISHFITDQDDKRILKVLSGNEESFYRYFERNLFLSGIKASSKEEALKIMVDNIRKHRDLPEGFYEGVLKRENLANTCFAKGIAMPHPYEILTEDTFVSIGILEKSVDWTENQKVKIVLLSSFAAKFAKENDTFFECLSTIISSQSTLRELAKAEDYDTFIDIMKKKLGD